MKNSRVRREGYMKKWRAELRQCECSTRTSSESFQPKTREDSGHLPKNLKKSLQHSKAIMRNK